MGKLRLKKMNWFAKTSQSVRTETRLKPWSVHSPRCEPLHPTPLPGTEWWVRRMQQVRDEETQVLGLPTCMTLDKSLPLCFVHSINPFTRQAFANHLATRWRQNNEENMNAALKGWEPSLNLFMHGKALTPVPPLSQGHEMKWRKDAKELHKCTTP